MFPARYLMFLIKILDITRSKCWRVTAFPKQWDTTGVMKMESIKQQLLKLPVIKIASLTDEVPDRKPPNAIPFCRLMIKTPSLLVYQLLMWTRIMLLHLKLKMKAELSLIMIKEVLSRARSY